MQPKKSDSLYHYIDKTLELIDNEFLEKKSAFDFLKKIETQFEDKSDLYSYSSYFKSRHLEYWTSFLFNTQEEILDYLEQACQNNWQNNHKLVEVLVNKFLNFPTDVKKSFYEKNLSQFENSKKTSRLYTKICGVAYTNLDTEKAFHNLPIYIVTNDKYDDTNFSLFEKVCDDYKVTLNMNHTQFIDRFGHTLLHSLNRQEIKKYWDMLEINKRQDLQQSYAYSFFKHNRLNAELFIQEVENKIVPYDLKLPNGKHYLMSYVIHNCFNKLPNLIEANDINIETFTNTLQTAKEKFLKLRNQYDLYFMDEKMIKIFISENLSLLSEKLSKKTYYGKNDMKKEMHVLILNFQMEMNDLLKGQQLKEEKKLKL